MGCWNQTCGLTNLHIRHSDDVMVFAMVKNRKVDSLCYTTPFYSPVMLPFYAKYDDYGGGEECSGVGLPFVIEGIRERLVEMPLGANEYHDIAVKKANFDDHLFFEACQERRLFVDGYRNDRQHVEFVMIRKDVVDHMIENRVMEKYVGDGKGTHGWGNNYINYKFSDIVADVPAIIEHLVKTHKSGDLYAKFDVLRNLRKFEDSNFAALWLRGDNYRYSNLVSIEYVVKDLVEADKIEEVEELLTEHLKALFVDSIMSDTRKFWSPQAGAGSQQQEHEPYRLLMSAMDHVLNVEKAEWDEENLEEFEE